jgi:hypothetical protein
MSDGHRRIARCLVSGLVLVLAVGLLGGAAEADVGAVLRTVNIPTDAQCSGSTPSTGSALAVVSGGKAGYPKIPVLLVTSCVSGTQVNLFLLDPFDSLIAEDSYNAKRVNTISTVFPTTPPPNSLPTLGWEALVLRADKGDLLACGTNGAATVLWSVDFSPFNNPTVPDGRATFLRNGPPGSSCDAIAWDASTSNKTIFQTPAAGANVFYFTETGSPSSISSGCTTPIRGLGIAGTSLFVGCEAPPFEGSSKIRQVYKVDGTSVRELFGEFPDHPAGLPDDPTTLASEYKELLWTLDASSAQVLAVEIPGGTIGQLTGVPVPFPGACPTGTQDTDGDGLLDCWETSGVDFDGDGTIDLQLCVMVDTNGDGVADTLECADPNHKDLFVEIDYMQFHKPDPVALGQVVQVFANAPTPPGPIRLHVQVDNENPTSNPPGIPHNNTTAFVPCTVAAASGAADYDLLKAQFFGTAAERSTVNGRNAKALAFRYGMFVHNLSPAGNTTSGCAEIGGNDFVVSLGSWAKVPPSTGHNVGTTDQQAGTLLHELGHTLGLRHGGGDNINCKPNYDSVMNYTRQFSGPTNRVLDYSSGVYGVTIPGTTIIGLNKASLTEANGIGLGDQLIENFKVAYGPVPTGGQPALADTLRSTAPIFGISWNKDTDLVDSTLALDINQTTNASGGCPARQKDAASNQEVLILEGFNDWAHLQFNFRASVDVGDGSRVGSEQPPEDATMEMTYETAIALSGWIMDVKPNDGNNTIQRSVQQTLGVAIFSRNDNSVPPQLVFDAPGNGSTTGIDPATLILRGTGGATWEFRVNQNARGTFQCNARDMNQDRLSDLVCNFTIPPNTIGLQETRVVLEGTTFDGKLMLSSDFIKVVP